MDNNFKSDKFTFQKPKNPLVFILAMLGLLCGILSTGTLLLYPKENYWILFSLLTIIFFVLLKVVKKLFG